MSHPRLTIPTVVLSAVLFVSGSIARIYADDDTAPDADSSNHGVARLSTMTGDVSVRRSDSGDYVAAAINAPLVANDAVATGPSGRAELQFDYANFLRLDHDAEVRLTDIESARLGMQIARGTVTYRVLRDSTAQIELSTPSVSVRPMNRATVRVSVRDDGQTEVTVRSGQAEIFTPRGVEQLGAGQTMMARGSASDPEFQMVSAIPRDDWDNWNDTRDGTLQSSTSYRHVSPDVYGAEDLDPYGRWVTDPNYGQVWSPFVADDWAPYRDGRWVWAGYYGWSWMGYEPWGWAPYHYGNWFYGSAGWCWYPGSRFGRHFWRPAVVGFFGFGGGRGGFGFGFGNVGWVPLAPFERFRPWYGRGFGGRNFTVVNNTNIYNTFRNARARNGVTGVNANHFAAGGMGRNFSVSRSQIGQAGLVQGGLPLRPTGQGLRFSDRQANFAPRGNSFSRPFVSRGAAPGSTFARGDPGLGSGGSDWRHFGQAGQAGRGFAGQPSAPVNRDPGGSRFGSARGGMGSAPASGERGNWQRFSQNGRGYSAPQSPPRQSYSNRTPSDSMRNGYSGRNYNAYGGGFAGRATPSVPRTYGSSPGYSGRSAPSYSAPSYSRSAPSYSGRSFGGGSSSVPRSGGSGAGGFHGGGGASHGGGGSGGGHRR